MPIVVLIPILVAIVRGALELAQYIHEHPAIGAEAKALLGGLSTRLEQVHADLQTIQGIAERDRFEAP